jgi:hypothetical protein
MALTKMKTTNARKDLSGYILPGSLISIACVGLMVAGANVGFSKHGSLNAAVAEPSLTADDQDAYAVMSQDIRAASSVESFQPDQLVLSAPNGSVAYTFDSVGHTLTRTSSGESRTLLTGVNSLAFSLLHRGGSDVPFGTMVPASITDAKAVACHWSCSRKLAGAKLGSDSFQMTPVMLRNRKTS